MKKSPIQKKMPLYFVAFVLLGSILMSSCAKTTTPSTTLVTKIIRVGDLSDLIVSDKIIVYYSPEAKTDSLKITGPKNMVDKLKIKNTSNGFLSLRIKQGDKFICASEEEYIKVWLSQPGVSTFTAMEKAQIHASGPFQATDDIMATVFTSAEIHFNALLARSIELNAFNDGKIICDSLFSKHLGINAFTQAEIVVSGKTDEAAITSFSASVDSKGLEVAY